VWKDIQTPLIWREKSYSQASYDDKVKMNSRLRGPSRAGFGEVSQGNGLQVKMVRRLAQMIKLLEP
jgi:hypothetical protein